MTQGFVIGTPLPAITCPYCGRELKQIVYQEPNVTAYTPEYERCGCPGSESALAEKESQEARRRQDEERYRHRSYVEQLLARSGIRTRYRAKSFDNFAVSPDNSQAYKTVRAYVVKFPALAREGKGLYLYGSCGVGKTHLATAAALELIHQERPVICMTGVEMLAKLKQTYNDQSNISEYEILRDFLAADLLVIDDLGKENVTEWSLSMLYNVVNMRIGDQKPLIVTTNYADDQLIARLSRSGDAMTARAIVSRLHEVCYGIEMTGSDYRGSPQK